MNSDDGINLWVNGQLVISAWRDTAGTNASLPITLSADTNYSIRLEYYERSGTAAVRLHWAFPGQSTQVIPRTRLYP